MDTRERESSRHSFGDRNTRVIAHCVWFLLFQHGKNIHIRFSGNKKNARASTKRRSRNTVESVCIIIDRTPRRPF